MRVSTPMPILRLAYTTQFLIALIAIFALWAQVGGQSHLDLMPWYLKLGLAAGASFATVKATAAAVGSDHTWNGSTLKWFGIVLGLLVGCGLASYYYHVYGETDEEDQTDSQTSWVAPSRTIPRLVPSRLLTRAALIGAATVRERPAADPLQQPG